MEQPLVKRIKKKIRKKKMERKKTEEEMGVGVNIVEKVEMIVGMMEMIMEMSNCSKKNWCIKSNELLISFK